MQIIQNRRTFLARAAAAGVASLVGGTAPARAEPPPETTTVRLPLIPAACTGPLFMAEELLREEGFSEIHFVPAESTISIGLLVDGEVDISMEAAMDYLPLVDVGKPLTVLGGLHVGCHELRANDSINAIRDLRGRKVGISNVGSTEHLLVAAMASYVGVDPTGITWVADPNVSQVDLFEAGKIDAFIGFPPGRGQPCRRNVGHVVVNFAHDYPWSNYFCCLLTANSDFVRQKPVAAKRALRAMLKATDLCHTEPERAARRMVGAGFSEQCALMILRDARYGIWRDYDPEDTVRFFALRLHELGMIRKTPSEIIAGFTDWRFLDEVRDELKI